MNYNGIGWCLSERLLEQNEQLGFKINEDDVELFEVFPGGKFLELVGKRLMFGKINLHLYRSLVLKTYVQFAFVIPRRTVNPRLWPPLLMELLFNSMITMSIDGYAEFPKLVGQVGVSSTTEWNFDELERWKYIDYFRSRPSRGTVGVRRFAFSTTVLSINCRKGNWNTTRTMVTNEEARTAVRSVEHFKEPTLDRIYSTMLKRAQTT